MPDGLFCLVFLSWALKTLISAWNFCGSSEAPSEKYHFLGLSLNKSKDFQREKRRTFDPLLIGVSITLRPTRILRYESSPLLSTILKNEFCLFSSSCLSSSTDFAMRILEHLLFYLLVCFGPCQLSDVGDPSILLNLVAVC